MLQCVKKLINNCRNYLKIIIHLRIMDFGFYIQQITITVICVSVLYLQGVYPEDFPGYRLIDKRRNYYGEETVCDKRTAG